MQNQNDENNDPNNKKGISGNFWVLALIAIVGIFFIQNFITPKMAQVSFNYQLEHLTNLDLLQPEESKKTALNERLVTFSGEFRNQKTEGGKERYRFLELLDKNNELEQQQDELQQDLTRSRQTVQAAAEWFIQISGLVIPKEGFSVVSNYYDSPGKDNSILLHPLADKRQIVSLTELSQKLSTLATASKEEIIKITREIASLVQNFRSPILGIADPAMKNKLKLMAEQVDGVLNNASHSIKDLMAIDRSALSQLQDVVSELEATQFHMRLYKLRSVRQYRETLLELSNVQVALEDNRLRLDKARDAVANVIWFFNNQELSTRALERQDPEAFNQWFEKAKDEWKNFDVNKGLTFRAPDEARNLVLEKTFKSEEPTPNYFSYLFTLAPVVIVLLLLYFLFARQMKGVGSSAMSFGKSPARLLDKSNNKVTFKDVAGIDEAKEELYEIVDFLKNPSKFTALGATIPKGVLCVGPPGTGKTLIAKAVAGEANRPFFSISGSDFVEMFVGVGASRIRDTFEKAKKNAPCIIFIDEIDAVGRHRGAGIGGGHDEREQTLNQLLVEMDGFDTNEGVIVIAATNRPDVLDKALLRPGRFDRRVVIDLPDMKGRYEILKVHARNIKIDETVDLMGIARGTPGCAGADLKNLLNEAALLAARKDRTAVTNQDIVEARDKVRYGKERRSLELDETEKKHTAIHESGHTVVGLIVDHKDPIDKVTIVPRGFSLGATHFLPEKNKLSYWRSEIVDRLAIIMGGRAAEEVFLDDVSSGAKQDIEQATEIAKSMICEWGMSDKLGIVAYRERANEGSYLGLGYQDKGYSEQTAQKIDEEIKRLTDESYQMARDIVEAKKENIQLMTEMLLEFETLDATDIKKIMDGSWDIQEKRKRLEKEATMNQMPVIPPPPPPLESSDTNEHSKKEKLSLV